MMRLNTGWFVKMTTEEQSRMSSDIHRGHLAGGTSLLSLVSCKCWDVLKSVPIQGQNLFVLSPYMDRGAWRASAIGSQRVGNN